MTRGLSGQGFDIDLLNGQAIENALREILVDPTLEVKDERRKCPHTGNIFVEYTQYGRPSGIQITSAKYWAVCYAEGCFLIVPVHYLKRIADRKWKRGHMVNGGDYDMYRGVLIPIDTLVPH